MKRLIPALTLACAALAGCAGGPGQSTGTDTQRPRTSKTAGDQDSERKAEAEAAPAGCPGKPGKSLPDEFPENLPVPDGATITRVEHRSDDRLVVSAVVRDGFRPTLSFLQKRLPQAGFELEEGEVEEHDAESNFSSGHVRGRWAVRTMPDCENGVFLTYLTAPR